MASREQLSDRLVDAAKSLKVLSALSWSQRVANEFLESWRKQNPKLPTIREKQRSDAAAELAAIERECDAADPVQAYLARTAHSYRRAADLLEHVGTSEFHRISREIYGGANGTLLGSDMTHREAATRLLDSSATLAAATQPVEGAYCVTAHAVADQLAQDWEGFFDTPMRIVIDADLSAKAAASSSRVRLRSGTCFTDYDARQLSAHEIGVHALTSRNGRKQSRIRALGLGAPRTTATQEGLATFAELVTGAIDLARLRRIALRIEAIHLAEEGADFVQVFERLLELDEPENEAVRTTMRVFRGGDVRGRYPFTKDVVYLKGLFAMHTYLRKAISEHRVDVIERLFVGRVTLGDIDALEGAFDDAIDKPTYLPTWAKELPALAAFLSVSAIIDAVDLKSVQLHKL